MANTTRGWTHTPEVRARISDTLTGRVITDEWRTRMSEGHKREWAEADTSPRVCETCERVFKGPRGLKVHQGWSGHAQSAVEAQGGDETGSLE